MKKISKRLLAIILSIVMLTSCIPAYANYVTASLLTNSTEGHNWMSQIDGTVKISDISIPGTHDSGARTTDGIASAWAKTQDLTIAEQLNAGVRYLDMRLKYNSAVYGGVQVVHSSINLWDTNGELLTLLSCIEQVYNFLDKNPTETVIMSFKEDDGSNESSIVSSINSYISANSKYWYQSYYTPNLDAVRGKIVVSSRMNTLRGLGLNWGDQGSDGGYVQAYASAGELYIQDRYNMGTSNKWNNAVVPLLEKEKPDGAWFVNFLSTTGANINGVASNASIMNSNFSRHEFKNNKCYGIIVMDYVTDSLAKKVFKCNDKVAINQPDSTKGQYYYRLNWNTSSNVSSGWSKVCVKLHYKTQNGTNSIFKSITLFDNTDQYNGYQFVCNQGNWDFSGWLDGFPISVEFIYDWGYGAATLAVGQKLLVGKSPNDELTQVITNNFVNSSYASTPCKGDEIYETSYSARPKVTSIEFAYSRPESINVPSYDSSNNETLKLGTVAYDQYGVNWYRGATGYTLNDTYNGISIANDILTVDSRANDIASGTEILITANYKDGTSTISSAPKKITIYSGDIYYKFVNYNGDILQDGFGKSGEIIEYVNDEPIKEPDSEYHYTFNGFSSSTNLSTTNNIFEATYSAERHSISRTEVGKEATCVESGYRNIYCSCGYSWTSEIKKLNHEITTEDVPAGCVNDGHHKVYCKNCDYVEAYDLFPAFGHDIEHKYLGDHVDFTDSENGYTTYKCPVCNEDIEGMKVYDEIDWSAYNNALQMFNDIIISSEYQACDDNFKANFEQTINGYRDIENTDESVVLQFDIDAACANILSTINDFSNQIGVTFYSLSFVYTDGRIVNQTYIKGTKPTEVTKPKNTPYLITDDEHTVYKWQSIKTVNSNATYYEVSSTGKHNYSTEIFPDEYFDETCTEPARYVKKCLCGHTITEYSKEPLGHSFAKQGSLICEATVDSPAIYAKQCIRCSATSGTMLVGDKLPSAYVNYINYDTGEEVVIEETNDNVSALVNRLMTTPMQMNNKIFNGWYIGDDILEQGTSRFNQLTEITAKFTDITTMAKDELDEKNVDDYMTFELVGVQIRASYCKDEISGETYGGLRYIASLSNDLINTVNIKEYGFVVASKANADINANGNDNYVIKSGDKNVKRIKCSDLTDHRTFDEYRLYTFVVDYENNEELKDEDIVVRPYIIYYDANGIARIYYGSYRGNVTYGGCSTSYNKASTLI